MGFLKKIFSSNDSEAKRLAIFNQLENVLGEPFEYYGLEDTDSPDGNYKKSFLIYGDVNMRLTFDRNLLYCFRWDYGIAPSHSFVFKATVSDINTEFFVNKLKEQYRGEPSLLEYMERRMYRDCMLGPTIVNNTYISFKNGVKQYHGIDVKSDDGLNKLDALMKELDYYNDYSAGKKIVYRNKVLGDLNIVVVDGERFYFTITSFDSVGHMHRAKSRCYKPINKENILQGIKDMKTTYENRKVLLEQHFEVKEDFRNFRPLLFGGK